MYASKTFKRIIPKVKWSKLDSSGYNERDTPKKESIDDLRKRALEWVNKNGVNLKSIESDGPNSITICYKGKPQKDN